MTRAQSLTFTITFALIIILVTLMAYLEPAYADTTDWPDDCPIVTIPTHAYEDEQQPTVLVRRDLPNGAVILHYLPLVAFEYNELDATWQSVYTCS